MEQSYDVDETSLPLTAGGYRVGRRLARGRFLGHALAPSLVELVFLNELSHEQQRIVCAVARDFSSLPDGGRVAILERAANSQEAPEHASPVSVRLTTPPDLVESWRHMEQATAAASTPPYEALGENDSLLARVSGLIKRAKRGPLVLAVIAGVVALVAVVALVPGTPSDNVSAGVLSGVSSSESSASSDPMSNPMSDAMSNSMSSPFSSEPSGSSYTPAQTPSPSQFSNPTEPLVPLSSLGDFILVRLPAQSGKGAGEIAVLERSADSWMVRETYPDM